MIEYLKNTSGETEYLLRYPDEVNFTLESEKEILGRLLEDPYSIMMAPVVDGKVAGNGSINGIGTKRKIRHRCSLAVAIYKEYWGLGEIHESALGHHLDRHPGQESHRRPLGPKGLSCNWFREATAARGGDPECGRIRPRNWA